MTARSTNHGEYCNMACVVNAIYLGKKKAGKDVVTDLNGRKNKYDTHLETET